MSKITVITGDEGSGKSTKARELASGKKIVIKYLVSTKNLNSFF